MIEVLKYLARAITSKTTGFTVGYINNPLANVRSINNLLARIVAKIQDETRLVEIIRNTPIIHNNPNWRCQTWGFQTLSRIAQDGRATGTAESDWGKIETVARECVATKIEFHS